MLDRLFGALAVVTLPLTFTGTTNVQGDASPIDWRAPSFAELEAKLRTCRETATLDRACFSYRTDAQHAYDAGIDCFSSRVEIGACDKIKKALAAETDAFFRTIEYADLRPRQVGGLRGNNPWISELSTAGSWPGSGLSSSILFGFATLISAVLAVLARHCLQSKALRREIEVLWNMEDELEDRILTSDSLIRQESAILAPYERIYAQIDLAFDSVLNAPGTPNLAGSSPTIQASPSSSKALDAVLGKTSSRRSPVEAPKTIETYELPEIWVDHTVRDKHGVAAGFFYFEVPAVPVVLEVRISRDHSVRPGKPPRFNVWRHARFASWDHQCELANYRPDAYKKLLGWSSCISLECDERHVEAQAICESMAWLLSALRREIAVGGETLSTKEYKDALSFRNAHQAERDRATVELIHTRSRIAELQEHSSPATSSFTAAIIQTAGSTRRRFSSIWRGCRR